MNLSFTRCRHLPTGACAQELFQNDELRALLSKSGYYLSATHDGVDYYAFSARFGLSPHPALEHLDAVRFLPEDAKTGTSGHFLIGISETEGRYVRPDATMTISF